MKITLIFTGKTEEDFVKQGLDHYVSRIKHYLPFEIRIISQKSHIGRLPVGKLSEIEGNAILEAVKPFDYIILLDEAGSEKSSIGFADFLQNRMNSGIKQLCFVIGGAYGFSDKVRNKANFSLSLSKMTFPHQLVRLIFTEQLYRALSILRNEKYHHT